MLALEVWVIFLYMKMLFSLNFIGLTLKTDTNKTKCQNQEGKNNAFLLIKLDFF